MNRIQVKFFASLADRTGKRSIDITIPNQATIAVLKDRLAQEYPALLPTITSTVAAINHEFAVDDTVIPDNAEIALFPPVSGG